MTPERKEEIKRILANGEITREVFNELLAALEEAEKKAGLAYAAYEGLQGFCVSRGEYESLLNKHSTLARAHREAQQTIVRLDRFAGTIESIMDRAREALSDDDKFGYQSGLKDILDYCRTAFGEGAKES